jgi:UDP-3-O-[3-hydroxymyristoyl] glucosamine N-acyltransferase
VNLADLSNIIDGKLIGDSKLTLDYLSPLNDQKENSISFILDEKQLKTFNKQVASAFITFKEIKNIANQIIIKNPQKALAKTIDYYLKTKKNQSQTPTQISETSSIHPKVVIGHSSTIGENCTIEANCVIGNNCKLGNNVILHPNITIYDNTVISNNVIIHAGTVIGADGFGYYKDNNCIKKIHHIGSVIIESNVEIGANCCIDKGCLGKTIIKNGSKLDNLIQIAHNASIGKNTLIAAQCGLTGSVKIGNNVTIGGQAGIYATIEDNAVIAGKSGVTKPIKSNYIVSGFPADTHKTQLKKQAFINKLYKEKHQ